MSFMFHPLPFKDPRAVNPVPANAGITGCLTEGIIPICKRIAAEIAAGKRHIAIDGYPGAQFASFQNTLTQYVGTPIRWVETQTLCLPAATLAQKLSPYLPEDREIDPVLLYGRLYTGGYEGLFDAEKVTKAVDLLADESTAVVIIGPGALCDALRPHYDLRVWIDITPKQAALNFKYGRARNLGTEDTMPYGLLMRRNYYVDFEAAQALRWSLIRARAIDLYISADDPDQAAMLPLDALLTLFDLLEQKPLRCRPVYLEGVWGGFYMKRLRSLPAEARNCAWIFDMIPMEVSLAATFDGHEFEVPFFTFVQAQGEKLLGKHAFDTFGGYFPMRFNYDDTYHASGNMSIQCHPGEAYLIANHGELGAQDESYYICVTGQDACTYLGFREEGSCEAFLAEADRAQHSGALVEYRDYIHAVPSVPGTQVMIPAGTIHASGRNQVILEIGSLTVGSYTYKLYDYQRIDPITCLPRPIHLNAGKLALRPERTAGWVEDNLVNHGGVVREGDTWRETIVGEHDLMYISLRTLSFETDMQDDTCGTFHVLTLVDGERVRVESLADASRCFTAQMLDILVVPADFGPYRLVNEGLGRVTVHKTLLKEA